MLFNSYYFILFFLPVCLCGYYTINHLKKYQAGKYFLLAASILFYLTFNPKLIIVISASIIINYMISLIMNKNNHRLGILRCGIIINLAILLYFKYFNFFLSSLNQFFHHDIPLFDILLPLGISFFTFQQISFLYDSYKDKRLHYSFIDYALHILLFLYIISGPIVTHKEIIPQFNDISRKNFHDENFARGLMSFILGLSKKVLIADTFAAIADIGFTNITSLTSTTACISMFAYTFQIYFDFSGYSDMVIGIGKMLNFDIPLNFNSPYKASSIVDFWKRWHMTLTRFFTNYIYIPLGGSRKSKHMTYLNIMIVFLISGFWHGANWTFIFWGLLHGCASLIYRVFQRFFDRIPYVINWLLTFLFVNFTWVIFRCNTIQDAFAFFSILLSGNIQMIPIDMSSAAILPEFLAILKILHLDTITIQALYLIVFFLLMLMICLFMPNTNEIMKHFKANYRWALICVILFVWSLLSLSHVTSYIYVNF